ncbi:MAG: hypothetical protein HC805_07290 [Alkalinema sp. RL_2_19]|nr:hypothetical protein [Alkalinema sp. RL_2_19]
MSSITLNRRQIHQLELFARKAPQAYRHKVSCYMALGYATLVGYILAAALLALIFAGSGLRLFHFFLPDVGFSLFALGLLGSVAIGLSGAAVTAWRSLTKEIYPPTGLSLQHDQAPALFACLDRLCQQAGSAPIDQVLLTPGFRVAVCQHTRVIGWGRSNNYLIVGIPLLASLSPQQFQALVGHELGHIAKQNEPEFTRHIYGLRQTWLDLLYDVEARRSIFEGLVSLFLRRYVPQFLTYSLPWPGCRNTALTSLRRN